MTPIPRPSIRSTGWWLIPVLLAGLFHAITLPFESELALQNDANFYLGGAASLAAGTGYRVEPYLDLPSVSQYPPLQSAWLALFWNLGGGFPGNIPWMIGAMEGVSLAMLALLGICLRREGIPPRIGAAFVLLAGTSLILLNLTFLLFSDLTVDSTTGQITLRAEVPNPTGELLPGLYVRVRLEQAQASNAITLPQQAVTRTAQGDTVMVVGDDGKVSPRPIKIGSAKGSQWVVLSGLKAGEKVMVDGFQKLQPGATVKPVAWQAPGTKPAASAPAAPATPASAPAK